MIYDCIRHAKDWPKQNSSKESKDRKPKSLLF